MTTDTVVAEEWIRSAANRKGVELDLWTVLPDGIEGIVILNTAALPISSRSFSGYGAEQKPWILSSFIASFKAAAAKRINLRRNQLGEPVWQRNYQEQFIPDEATPQPLAQPPERQGRMMVPLKCSCCRSVRIE